MSNIVDTGLPVNFCQFWPIFDGLERFGHRTTRNRTPRRQLFLTHHCPPVNHPIRPWARPDTLPNSFVLALERWFGFSNSGDSNFMSLT